ncbi:PQQ-dependent sugar dehydrogenase [Neolewinella maritima]|nr:PQQ-dependent sugar dehydrogenase [Neolewinella maritima]
MTVSRLLLLFSVVFILLVQSCADERRELERIDLPEDSPLLTIQPGNYRMLDEDSLFQYRNLALIDIEPDSLTVHRRRAVERFVLAGGRLLIRDAQPDIPYAWPWYAKARRAGAKEASPLGAGLVYAPTSPLDTASSRQYFTTAIAPVAPPALVPAAPRWDRFQVEVLDNNIYEPMEMEVLPGGEVLFLERRGKMKLYDPFRRTTTVVKDFDVCTEGNYEDGLHGLALDPGYGKENHYVYLYYSPAPCDSTDQLLSRWVFKNGQLEEDSETEVLRVAVQREQCCHSGGSVEFGPDGLLYLSTGDNTSSKASDGYSPIDERPGRGPWDAQKSSGNTHDLRGKILRIRPLVAGGYEVPEGNLFAADGSDGRPEIYVMGARNPFRITIDPWSNYLYWGDVGPDVGEPGKYGPESYDEWNQARRAGNFGWPYFVGDNYAFRERDFATDEVGDFFDPAAPVNESPNNFGSRELPPAQPALMWYPYGPSEEFPQLGEGSRSAMTGPFYNADGLFPIASQALPAYYHGKWFIYEWARSWIKVVTLDSARQQIVQIEDFLPDVPISKPIDFKIGRDGAIYLLEYGNDYFLNNPDARLVRISYSEGNRPPVARLEVDETAGGIPFRPVLSAASSTDPDPKDRLSYRWYVDGETAGTGARLTPVISRAGKHTVRLEVYDRAGARSEVTQVVTVGNARPQVALQADGNSSFLFDAGSALPYRTQVSDPEDAAAGTLDTRKAVVNAAWITDVTLVDGIRRGERQLPAGDLRYAAGETLIEASDCYTCHKERSENVGPSFLQVAEHYDDAQATVSTIAKKVIRGGNGVWGERLMSAHPTLSTEDAETMVGYILSLNNGGRMPLAGTTRPGVGEGSYVLAATYRDGGGAGDTPPLVGQGVIVLRPPTLQAEAAADGLYRAEVPGSGQPNAFQVVAFRPGGHMRMADIDLTNIGSLNLHLHPRSDGDIELRLGSPDGELLASQSVAGRSEWNEYTEVELSIAPRRERGDLYLVWSGEGGVVADDMGHHRPADIGWIDYLTFRQGGSARYTSLK